MPTGKARVFTQASQAIGPQPAKAGDSLTPRELEIAALLGEGLSNKLVADRVGISEHTAKFHINRIMIKLDVNTRTEAAMRFHMMTHKCVRLESAS